ncbi:MAG: DUF2779 domain-containing protein [Fidelibacterota bacterium]
MQKGSRLKRRLSKSKYLSGRQCHKRLWLEIHHPELAPPPPPSQQRIFDQGTRVGELAREQFPGGLLIEAEFDEINLAIEQTQEALQQGAEIIFEGCFIYHDVLVRPDVMKQTENGGWILIEVKSSTTIKEENLHDVAIQSWVLQGCGQDVERMFLMHINRDCVYPDLSNLFQSEDITGNVRELLPLVPDVLTEYRRILRGSEPKIAIGSQCGRPYACPFTGYCWQHVPEFSIFTLPNLRWPVKERLIGENYLAIDELPVEFPLTDSQQRYVDSLKTKKPVIDRNRIREELDALQYPLYFLDFETDGPAIPRFNGMHPYEQFPFQYSCHILHSDGRLDHWEYLHETLSDPRNPLLESLIETLGSEGTIIAYNAGFEKSILSKLAEWYPEHSRPIRTIIQRGWDQLLSFRKYYTDYRFKGSNSLKGVLPVLVPGMNYESLEVSNGTEAQVAWNEMIRLQPGLEKERLVRDLLTYCGQDTLAMVEIHKRLHSLIDETG